MAWPVPTEAFHGRRSLKGVGGAKGWRWQFWKPPVDSLSYWQAHLVGTDWKLITENHPRSLPQSDISFKVTVPVLAPPWVLVTPAVPLAWCFTGRLLQFQRSKGLSFHRRLLPLLELRFRSALFSLRPTGLQPSSRPWLHPLFLSTPDSPAVLGTQG